LKKKILELCPEREQHELIVRPTFHIPSHNGRMKASRLVVR